jgi:hypothetical protein
MRRILDYKEVEDFLCVLFSEWHNFNSVSSRQCVKEEGMSRIIDYKEEEDFFCIFFSELNSSNSESSRQCVNEQDY